MYTPKLHSPISPSETAVLKLLHQGKQTKVIAHDLGLSEHTIKAHLRSMFIKTGTHSRNELILMTLKHMHRVPEGWKLVPIEPVTAQKRALLIYRGYDPDAKTETLDALGQLDLATMGAFFMIYKVMVEAAPEPPK